MPSLPVAIVCAALGALGGHFVSVWEWRDVTSSALWTAGMAIDGYTVQIGQLQRAITLSERCRDGRFDGVPGSDLFDPDTDVPALSAPHHHDALVP